MSLADELEAEDRQQLRNVDTWLGTLDDANRAAVEAWAATPGKSSGALWRVARRHGFEGGLTNMRNWVAKQRDDS